MQWSVYQKYDDEVKARIREYFEKLEHEKFRNFDKMREYLNISY